MKQTTVLDRKETEYENIQKNLMYIYHCGDVSDISTS